MCALDEVIIKVMGRVEREAPGAAWKEQRKEGTEANGERAQSIIQGQAGEWEGEQEPTEERSLSLSANFLTG